MKKLNFERASRACELSSGLSARVVDDFLLYYAAGQDRLDKEFEAKLSGYRDVIRLMDNPSWRSQLKSQYIVHRVFREGGLIHKYLNHTALKRLSDEEMGYLRFQAAHPWRFSFSRVTGNPANQFYEMEDVFRGDRYILHSRGMEETLSDHPVAFWLNLIGFNGECWQSFGPIVAFRGFDIDDIWFFATELNTKIDDEDGIIADVEKNPLPYCLLISGSAFPITVSQGHRIVQVMAENDFPAFDTEVLGDSFRREFNRHVYRLSPKKWNEPPHFAEAYYDEKRSSLVLTALTDRGFEALAGLLKQKGFAVSDEPQVRVSPAMITTAERILRRKIRINPYEGLFEKKISGETAAELDSVNHLLQLALPYVNSGREPDIESLARQAGVDPELAKQLIGAALARVKKLRGDQ